MGFEILDFPCDQFEHQAPGTNEEIAAFRDNLIVDVLKLHKRM